MSVNTLIGASFDSVVQSLASCLGSSDLRYHCQWPPDQAPCCELSRASIRCEQSFEGPCIRLTYFNAACCVDAIYFQIPILSVCVQNFLAPHLLECPECLENGSRTTQSFRIVFALLTEHRNAEPHIKHCQSDAQHSHAFRHPIECMDDATLFL